jgi:hypothetical protein
MKLNWFIRTGILFIPASIMGWLLVAVALAYAVYRFIDIDSRSHSVSDTLINFTFNLFIIGVIYSIIGFLSEKRPN